MRKGEKNQSQVAKLAKNEKETNESTDCVMRCVRDRFRFSLIISLSIQLE